MKNTSLLKDYLIIILPGQKKINQYFVSAADEKTRDDRKNFIEEQKKIFPGTGIIDEVLNFVHETDPNIENFGFSDENVYKSDICKIDFDRCYFHIKVNKKYYEKNILSGYKYGIYHALPHVQSNKEYMKEKIKTRLKLSILSKELINAWSRKAYFAENEPTKVIKEIVSRTNIALDLFLKHPYAKEYLEENPGVLSEIFEDSIQYINDHFDQKLRQPIIDSMGKRMHYITSVIKNKMKINVTFLPDVDMQYQPIHIAAKEGRLEEVQALIKNKPELLNQVDACGQTPLMWAASKGHLPVVKYLLGKHGVDLNVASQGFDDVSQNGKTALHWAADNGHNEVVDTLLKHGMIPSLAKTINKSKLNEKVKAEVKLLEYIPKRSSQAQYKTSFTLFCYKFNFGFSKQEKLNAANALKNVVINGANKSILDPYKEELNNGHLGSIYRSLQACSVF